MMLRETKVRILLNLGEAMEFESRALREAEPDADSKRMLELALAYKALTESGAP